MRRRIVIPGQEDHPDDVSRLVRICNEAGYDIDCSAAAYLWDHWIKESAYYADGRVAVTENEADTILHILLEEGEVLT